MRLNTICMQIFTVLFFSIALHAMEEEEPPLTEMSDLASSPSEEIDIESSITSIDITKLKSILSFAPPANWQMGQRHSYYLLSYALGTGFNATQLLDINATDFLPYAPPCHLTQFINSRLSSFSSQQVAVHRQPSMTKEALLLLIQQSIGMGAPLTVYVDKYGKLGLITVFGYTTVKGDTYLIMSTGLLRDKRVDTTPLDTLLKDMDLTYWLKKLQRITAEGASKYPDSDRISLAREFLEQLEPFTLIRYVPPHLAHAVHRQQNCCLM